MRAKARKFNGGLSVISWHKILHKKAGRGIQVVMAAVVVVALRVKGEKVIDKRPLTLRLGAPIPA